MISGKKLGPAARTAVLFANFALIILAYYQVKSASRSILIERGGADLFPYVWITSALVLGSFIGVYHRLVERVERLRVVLGSIGLFVVLMVVFRVSLAADHPAPAFAFYIFVDILSVILVEQFWSLTNTVYQADEGRRWYWLVSTGGLVGGVLGGAFAAALLAYTPITTPDLLLTCAATLVLVFALNLAMGRAGLYGEVREETRRVVVGEGWRALAGSRYLLLIAGTLLCAQFAQPVVEFQFIKAVEAAYTELDARTAFISTFFSVLGLVSIGVNLVLTPIIHRYLGFVAGMLTQPIVLACFSLAFMAHPVLLLASAMKIADRGLSYSINRASKEMLYIPVDPVRTYQAKAWIDMLGYRLFKVIGSVVIIVLTASWFPVEVDVASLGWATIAVCGIWIAVVAALAREYASFAPAPQPA